MKRMKRSQAVLCALSAVSAVALAGCSGEFVVEDGAAPEEHETSEQVDSVSSALTTYQVGAGKRYASLQAVAGLLNPGDVVEVYGNQTYTGGVRLTRHGSSSAKITIRGIRVNGKRPVLSGSTNTIELAGNNYVFEGFDVTKGTSRCVYHHANNVTIRDTVIHDCPAHGLLGADSGSGSLTLEHSEVYRCGSGDRLHQIYMATDETAFPGSVFRMRHNYVHDANGGHNVKSRAERNEIHYNWIEGAYYHELELIGPDGQDEALAREDSDVVGNVLFQGYTTRTHSAVRVGGDGTGQSWGRYRFVNNTIIMGNASTSAAFRFFDGIESVELHNNVLFRLGGSPVTVYRDAEADWKNARVIAGSQNWVPTSSTSIPSAWTGTRTGSNPGFTDIANKNVRLLSSSALQNVGTNNPVSPANCSFPSPQPLPLYESALRAASLPGTATARPSVGTIDLGAYEYSSR
jgi:hypothetical protein